MQAKLVLFVFLIMTLNVYGATNVELEGLKARLSSEGVKKSCASALPLANSIYVQDPNDVLALQTIVRCTQSQQHVTAYAAQTKEIFEQSKILSIIPKLLEVAQVKELVPILREVEVKQDKTVGDYLMISEIYERLGDPEKQLESLKEAVAVNPDDPRLFAILASKQYMTGHQDSLRDGVKGFLQSYLSSVARQPGHIYLMVYVLALSYPIPLSLGLVFSIWGLAFVIRWRGRNPAGDMKELSPVWPWLLAGVPSLLAFRFWQSGKALPVGALLLIMCAQVFFIAQPALRLIYRPVFRLVGRTVYFVFNGTHLAKKLASLSLASQFLVFFVALLGVSVVAPTIDSLDLKYGLIMFCSMILYATIGSLMINFLRSRSSLVTSLRWIGITATFPFLISYVISSWNTLGTPLLYGELPSSAAIDGLVSYLVFWGVSFFMALHLGKIIAQAFIQPLEEIMSKVARIEKGDFEAKAAIYSRDEIGRLGEAINRMGDGLGKREKIEKTFRKYIDGKIAERILSGVETEVRIEGQSVNAVALFADIRGFTSASEKTAPADVVKMLNQFFERMVKIVQRHGGVIDKYIGDNIMAIWGVPYAVEEAERKAVTAGLEMIKEIDNWNRELKAQGFGEIGIGIGINAGQMIAGSLGSSEHMEYTVIGDTVNTAQRAESVAKKQQLVITDMMYERVKELIVAEPLEPLKVKGKEGLQHWWSVKSLKIPPIEMVA